jgi:hypothetical protein
MVLHTDYLVVGGGASGLAFADSLVAEAEDVEVIVIDRRHAAGGHWLDAYPFVRLHTPSAYYGVNSLALGENRVDRLGENAGFYERATGNEVCEHFAEAASQLAGTGRVRMLTRHEHLGRVRDGEQVRDMDTGALHEVSVRRRVVDARYLEASIPATQTAPFDVASDARVVPVNGLPAASPTASSYVILGAGKTAADACIWLLDNDVEPDRIRWVRPRDAWFWDRRHFQPLEQVGAIMEGAALDAQAGAEAASIGGLFEQMEASARVARIDRSYPATMFRGTMLSSVELGALRQVTDVVRLGRVRRIEADRIVLEYGETNTDRGTLHVDCTALGLSGAPATPVFETGRIVLQQVRHGSPCFNAALVAFVEAHRDDDTEKNRLCRPNPYPSSIEDWPRMMSRTWKSEGRWSSEPDLSAWVGKSRLNLLQAVSAHASEPSVRSAIKGYLTHVATAVERLAQLDRSNSNRTHQGPVVPACGGSQHG